MELITRAEMIGLLKILADLPSTETKQGRGVRRRVERAIAALQAAEPVGIVVDNCGKNFVNWRGETPWLDSAKPGTELFTLPCPPAKAQVQDMHDGITYWENRALEMWEEMLRDLNNCTADEFWREELETIAEILEADGDEWNCAARIRKMLTASPAPDHIPDTEKMAEALKGLLAIISDSRGVDGYHLNGDIAEWDEFEEVSFAEDVYAAYIQQEEAER